MDDTMMALRAHHRGGPEVLVYEPAPVPTPAEGEVLVAVHAAAVTFAELSWDLSWTDLAGHDRTPVIPSHEVSGTVADLGPGVTDVPLGAEVYGLVDFHRDGAAAQYVAVPAATLALKPASVPHVDAAALPLAALTAWQALVDHAAVKPGERVLVLGGAGGVGVYGVQLAASLGAEVVATDLAAHSAFVRSLGATTFLERLDGLSDVDVVLDTVGGDALRQAFEALGPGGRVVTLGGPPPPDLAARFFVVTPDRDELSDLARMVDDGRLRPVVSQVFPLAEGRRAYAAYGPGRPPGKTILVV